MVTTHIAPKTHTTHSLPTTQFPHFHPLPPLPLQGGAPPTFPLTSSFRYNLVLN